MSIKAISFSTSEETSDSCNGFRGTVTTIPRIVNHKFPNISALRLETARFQKKVARAIRGGTFLYRTARASALRSFKPKSM